MKPRQKSLAEMLRNDILGTLRPFAKEVPSVRKLWRRAAKNREREVIRRRKLKCLR
jgi:hypothetical protein